MTRTLESPSSIERCLAGLFSNPYEILVKRWSWKASLFSPLCRGGLFFAANASVGMDAALGAMYAEFAHRSVTAGFYGAITQQFRGAEPRWAAVWVVAPGYRWFRTQSNSPCTECAALPTCAAAWLCPYASLLSRPCSTCMRCGRACFSQAKEAARCLPIFGRYHA